jgi:hypothetical protein
VAAMITAAAVASSDRELTPASIQSAEFESGTEEEVFQRRHGSSPPEPRSDVTMESGGSQESESEVRPVVTSESSDETRSEVTTAPSNRRPINPPEPTAPEGAELTPTNSHQEGAEGGLRDRQTSIVHASNLNTADQVAAARARVSAKRKKKRSRLSTDELTNQGEWSGCGLIQ